MPKISKTSVSSDWVKTEASEGKQRGILIPVLIERDVKIPLAFRRIQAADLRDWDGKLSHPEFDNLLNVVAGILGRPLPVQSGHRMEPEIVQPSVPRKMHRSIQEPERLAKRGNSIGMKFTRIPAGEFFMGSEEYEDEKPVHRVKINSPFYLGTYPVTQREWKAVMGDNPSKFKSDDLPVEQVSWNQVQEFIEKLNEKEDTDKYRLPSEAEWEYACRAGTTTRYSFGDDESKLGDYAWYSDNLGGETHPVGQKKPNPYGLYDMHGNVWEWVRDSWHGSYDGAPADGSAWEGGGGWVNNAWICRSADRNHIGPRSRDRDLGFRLLQEL